VLFWPSDGESDSPFVLFLFYVAMVGFYAFRGLGEGNEIG